jgi:S-adenosyl methyltransferase
LTSRRPIPAQADAPSPASTQADSAESESRVKVRSVRQAALPDAGPAVGRAGPAAADVSVAAPQAARRYDYLLGGKDNFAVDRQSGDELRKAFPAIKVAVLENRRFMRRAVHYLAADCGIRQFLDIGVGMPAAPNVHQIAQAVSPATRVVYVDHDPIVAVHAQALLTGSVPDVRVFVPGDLRSPEAILDSPVLRDTLDLQRPVGLLLVAVLHFIEDDELAYAAVRHLAARLPSGSYVALSHVTFDPLPFAIEARLLGMSAPGAGHGPFRARTREQVARFLDGLDIVEPGLVSTVEWHPERHPPAEAPVAEAVAYSAVARIP